MEEFFKLHVSLDAPREPSLLLILKWGGELTPAGRVQAEELGRIFRCMYPGGQGHFIFSFHINQIKRLLGFTRCFL